MKRDIRDTKEDAAASAEDAVVLHALSALKPDDQGEGIVPLLDELSERREIEAILDRMNAAMDPLSRRTDRSRILVAAISAAAVFALILIVFIRANGTPVDTDSKIVSAPFDVSKPAPIQETNRTLIPGSRFALLFGEVSLEDENVTAGSGIPASERIRTKNGKIALSLPTGIAVGLSENASARVLWNGKSQYGVSLMNGTALFSVDPTEKRDGFFVETPAGTVRVTGTLFSVMVSPDDGVFVKLFRGKVIVERPDGRTELMEGSTLTPLGQRKVDLTALDSRIEKQLQTIQSIDDGSLFTELKKLARHADKKTEPPRSPAARFGNDLSIQDLMSLARTRKADGDWTGAVSSYNELILRYADSEEALTSKVSLGQIYLNHLRKPKAAVNAFDDYLTKRGPLTQEALYGKAQAYRALHNEKREIESLNAFLEAFPKGVYSEAVRNRLNELQ